MPKSNEYTYLTTHFASPQRLSKDQIMKDITQIKDNPLIDGLMQVASGLFAVLNEHRQLLEVNDKYINMLGINDIKDILGMRVGETIGCIHANKMEAGCGTSEYCPTCGAAVAMVSSITNKEPAENKCAITAVQNGVKKDLFFSIRSFPISCNNQNYILIFLHDITKEQEYINLERVFFHDMNNLVFGILGRSELIQNEKVKNKNNVAKDIHQLALRLSREIAIQKLLFQSGVDDFESMKSEISVQKIIEELQNIFKNHNVSKNKSMKISEKIPQITLNTDTTILIRILCNMITNAFEASDEDDFIEMSVIREEQFISFLIWNRKHIDPSICKRIFQRNFSTKKSSGRGLGTYSMKLFGEKILGGKVTFKSSEKQGTTFKLCLPE